MTRANLSRKVTFKEKSKGNRRVGPENVLSIQNIKLKRFHLIFLAILLEVILGGLLLMRLLLSL